MGGRARRVEIEVCHAGAIEPAVLCRAVRAMLCLLCIVPVELGYPDND